MSSRRAVESPTKPGFAELLSLEHRELTADEAKAAPLPVRAPQINS
jgi:hypothetical protein